VTLSHKILSAVQRLSLYSVSWEYQVLTATVVTDWGEIDTVEDDNNEVNNKLVLAKS